MQLGRASALTGPTLSHVVVTGASSGIGAEFARRLHAAGHAVALVARRRERLERLAAELGSPPPVLVEPCDLSAAGAAEGLKRRLDEAGLAIHGLVNCAGLGLTGPFAAQPLETARSMCDVNVRALTELTRLFLPPMIERRRGFVINVASNAAFQPIPYLAVYAATKAFVLSFTEAIADELRGSGVSVQALCPGITGTEFLEVSGTRPELKVRTLPMMTASEVVEVSLAALGGRRARVVVGWPNRLLGFVTQRLAPNGLARRVAGELYRPRGKA